MSIRCDEGGKVFIMNVRCDEGRKVVIMRVRCDEVGGGGREFMGKVESSFRFRGNNGNSDGDEGDVRVRGCACKSVYDSEQWW